MNRRRLPVAPLAFRVGASPPVPPSPPQNTTDTEQDVTLAELRRSLRPTVIVVAILTGAAFAIGSGLVSHYLFRDHR